MSSSGGGGRTNPLATAEQQMGTLIAALQNKDNIATFNGARVCKESRKSKDFTYGNLKVTRQDNTKPPKLVYRYDHKDGKTNVKAEDVATRIVTSNMSFCRSLAGRQVYDKKNGNGIISHHQCEEIGATVHFDNGQDVYIKLLKLCKQMLDIGEFTSPTVPPPRQATTPRQTTARQTTTPRQTAERLQAIDQENRIQQLVAQETQHMQATIDNTLSSNRRLEDKNRRLEDKNRQLEDDNRRLRAQRKERQAKQVQLKQQLEQQKQQTLMEQRDVGRLNLRLKKMKKTRKSEREQLRNLQQQQQQQQQNVDLGRVTEDDLLTELQSRVASASGESVKKLIEGGNSLLAAAHGKSGHVLVQLLVKDRTTKDELGDLLAGKEDKSGESLALRLTNKRGAECLADQEMMISDGPFELQKQPQKRRRPS